MGMMGTMPRISLTGTTSSSLWQLVMAIRRGGRVVVAARSPAGGVLPSGRMPRSLRVLRGQRDRVLGQRLRQLDLLDAVVLLRGGLGGGDVLLGLADPRLDVLLVLGVLDP